MFLVILGYYEVLNTIDLTFNFPIPYITCMEDVKGSEYLQKIKEALKSKEFQSYTSPQRPYIIKFAELKSLSNIENCFPYNKEFGNALKKIAQQEFNMKNIKSLCISEVIFKGFTISMDVPSDGLFIAPPSSLEELVYIRTLTYGVTAYFVIASNNSYQNVLEAFKNSFMDEYYNPNGTITRIPNYFRFLSVRLNRLKNKLLANYLRNRGNDLATVRNSAFCVAILSNNSFICKYNIFFRKYELSVAIL